MGKTKVTSSNIKQDTPRFNPSVIGLLTEADELRKSNTMDLLGPNKGTLKMQEFFSKVISSITSKDESQPDEVKLNISNENFVID